MLPIDWNCFNWENITLRALVYATHRDNRMRWRGARDGSPPGGKTPEDFVSDAIIKTISGQRCWDPNKCDLLQHIIGVVSSEISHAAISAENISTVPTDDDNVINITNGEEPNPEQIFIYNSEKKSLLSYLEKIDPVLRSAAELLLEEQAIGNIDLAHQMGFTVKDVENLKKRLKRAVEQYLAETRFARL
ncbi:hypothetical protein ABNQ39_10465 [Azospirillum sp. A26]|uniref:hypothetical protein n=1 Tax=Azospirillum sp. A26 TaxID=3160607 RepID=UPI003671EBEF